MNEFTIGDKVLVTENAKGSVVWTNSMNDYIGKTFTIYDMVITVEGNFYYNLLEDEWKYFFPEEALQKVS